MLVADAAMRCRPPRPHEPGVFCDIYHVFLICSCWFGTIENANHSDGFKTKANTMSDKKKTSSHDKKQFESTDSKMASFKQMALYFSVIGTALLVAAISTFAILFAFFWRGPSDCEPRWDRRSLASSLELRLKGFTVFAVGNEGKLIEAAFFSAPEDIAENQSALLARRKENIEIHNYYVDQLSGIEWDIPSAIEDDEKDIIDQLTYSLNFYQTQIDAAFAVSPEYSSNNDGAYREKYNSVLKAWVSYRMTLQQLKLFLLQRVDHDSCTIMYTNKIINLSDYNDKRKPR